MEIEFTTEKDKLDNLLANEHELMIEQIGDCVNEFIKEPNYVNREILISLISQHDLNQGIGRGLLRVTEYEVGIINALYLQGKYYQINALITYLYDLITQITQIHKIASWCIHSSV